VAYTAPSFITAAEVKTRMGPDKVAQVFDDDGSGTEDTDPITFAIKEASALVGALWASFGQDTIEDLCDDYAVKGILCEIVMAIGHYDTAETTEEGAMDDASGVAVMLELARIFRNIEPDRTFIFMASDSEEFGAFWGSHSFIRSFDRIQNVVAVATFDFVAPEEQVAILAINDGLKHGYTPLWLRELSLDSLRSVSTTPGQEFEVRDMTGALELVQRAMGIPPAEHGAYLAAGIPALNWVGQMKNFTRQMAFYHHTPADRAEIMQERSMAQYGRSAERLMRSLNSLAQIPADFRNSDYLKVSSTLMLPGLAVRFFSGPALFPIPFLLRFQVAVHPENRAENAVAKNPPK
jgi:hypothetical protein